ncbi:MAG: DUF3035 domain-containing protein [Pseudomonadota bacterium]
MRKILAGLALLSLGACSNAGSDGPDEFGVVPTLPLVAPPDPTTLPQPTPGGANRADANPQAALTAALGGSASGGGVPQSDAELIAFASRFGVDGAIRSELFAADETLRDRRSRVRLFRGRGYFALYAGQTLDAAAELERFRAQGVAVPSAPPAQ